MKRLKRYVLLLVTSLLIGLTFNSCQKEPTACISASKTTAEVGEKITLSNCSKDAHSYEWSLENGDKSSSENVTYTASSAGTKTISLKVFSKNGKKSDETSTSITITSGSTSSPVANFSFTGDGGTAPRTVTFTNTSTYATSYSWNFGDGGTSTETNPSHYYTTSGTFTVQLTAYGASGSNSISKTVNITSSTSVPVANFTYTGAGGYAPCTVTFTNSSTNATSYSWIFGDGSTSTLANPSHTYTSGGTFTVQLTANGSGGSNSKTATITVIAAPTKAYIKKVYINSMPFIDGNGAGWDTYNGPDVYITIENYSGSSTYYDGDANNNYYSDLISSELPIYFYWNSPYVLVPISSAIYIGIYDNDSPDADDFIGWSSGFTLNSYTTYPTTITKTNSSGNISITLEILWQ